jgi:hypothetical protein
MKNAKKDKADFYIHSTYEHTSIQVRRLVNKVYSIYCTHFVVGINAFRANHFKES